MGAPQISVVLSTLGNHDVLRRVLDGYDAQDTGDFELLVVADQAEPDVDAVHRAIGDRSYPVRLLRGRIPGLSSNRNSGWQAAAAPIVLFTDNDTVPAPQLLSEHLAWHRRDPEETLAVVGLVRWAKGIKVTPFMRWLDHGVQFDYESIQGEEASWAHLYGANSSIKRALLDRVGGYDEERLPYGYEDLDWGYRAREHGLRVKFNRRAAVEHWREMTVENWQVRAPRLAHSERQFCELHPEIPPWFHDKLAAAAVLPAGGRRSAALTRVIPRGTPWLGKFVWSRADLHWRQQIAPYFLAAWEGGSEPVQPGISALAERSSSSGGS